MRSVHHAYAIYNWLIISLLFAWTVLYLDTYSQRCTSPAGGQPSQQHQIDYFARACLAQVRTWKTKGTWIHERRPQHHAVQTNCSYHFDSSSANRINISDYDIEIVLVTPKTTGSFIESAPSTKSKDETNSHTSATTQLGKSRHRNRT